MKKSLLIIIVLLCTASGAFAMHRDRKAEQKSNPNEIQTLSMRRTACFGRCPDYMITLMKGGEVVYTGNMFVEDSGVFEKKYDAAVVQALLDKAEMYRIDTCGETYPTRVMDIPGIVYWVTYKNGRQQRIMNANFGPDFLKVLARDIDEAIKIDKTWKPSKREIKY